MNDAIGLVADLVITFGLIYVLALTRAGLRRTRRAGVALPAQERLMDRPLDRRPAQPDFTFWFLIAALNESAVIRATVRSLLATQPGARVVVVDDGSDDDTAAIVESFESTGRVLLCRRTLPAARQGKGEALNAGLAVIRDEVRRAGASRARVIVGVMDADGRLTPNTTAVVADEFAADASLGGLQLVVRIRNRDSLMLQFQDMEFWAMAGLAQLGRIGAGSVSMGGNGQFTRLTALDEAGALPWSQSLTEDLDLGLTLAVRGWRTTSTAHAYVSQQGVSSFPRLVRQRTRWYQGHMMSIRRFPELARSRYLPTPRFLELSAYLAVPWLLSLPWSILQQYVLYQLAHGRGIPIPLTHEWWGRIVAMAVFYVASFAPNIFWGVTYWRRTRHVSLWRSLLMAHLLIAWSYVAYLAAWRALARMIAGRTSWTKTTREVEFDAASP